MRENGIGRRRQTARVAVAFLTLAAIVLCVVIVAMLCRPPQKAAADAPALGEAGPPSDAPAVRAGIHGHGTVAPKVRVEIMPEVSGRVVYVHSQLRAGGLIPANERILQVDPSGYELAVRRAQAVVDDAQARLDLVLAATKTGGREPRPDAERQTDLPLILREPQLRQARAVLESAKAELANAELQLARTSIVLPYDVLIAGETVSLGQYVDVGRSVAVAYGTVAFEIEVPVRVEDLGRIDALREMTVPGRNSETPATAEIKAGFAGGEHTWPGQVVGTTGRVDGASGRVSLIVEAPRPLETLGDRPPLLPGTAVEVFIPGDPGAGGGRGGFQTHPYDTEKRGGTVPGLD